MSVQLRRARASGSGLWPAGAGLAGFAALALLAFFAALALGPVTLPLGRVAQVLLDGVGGHRAQAGTGLRDTVIVLDVRLPRAVLGALVGAGTAAAGAIMQGVFRNPLADPGLIGVSPGAALSAVAWIVLGGSAAGLLPPEARTLGLPLAAFAGGLATTLLISRLAMREGYTSMATLLFAGLALGALASAGTGVLVFMASEQQSREFLFW
ncbi:MAG: iron ABC transporter, partial [Azorhizobium sp. 12-66-6]